MCWSTELCALGTLLECIHVKHSPKLTSAHMHAWFPVRFRSTTVASPRLHYTSSNTYCLKSIRMYCHLHHSSSYAKNACLPSFLTKHGTWTAPSEPQLKAFFMFRASKCRAIGTGGWKSIRLSTVKNVSWSAEFNSNLADRTLEQSL